MASSTGLFEGILERRSIRRYDTRPVSRALLEQLLSFAAAAPSAHNRQPWRFAVLTAEEDKHRLAQAMGDHLRRDRERDGDDPALVAADVNRSHARLTQAPALIVVSATLEDMDVYTDARRAEAERIMAIQSTAMAVQNLLLSAHAAQLGACWMCAPLFCPETVCATLELPAGWMPQAIVTVGYPAAAGKPFVRKPLHTVATFKGDSKP